MANLVDRRDTRVDKLSGGMRRRLLIARALVHRPRLVLLDEPTVGLDPQVRQELWALIDALRAEGTTILMSTHYIEEAQRLADTVLIMSHGKRRRRRAARASSSPSTPAARRSRSTARRRGSPRSRPRRGAPGCARGARARASRSSASRTRRRARPRASGGRRTSRTSSSCSPARRSTDGRRARPQRRLGRLERPALTGVLVREIVNFSSYWRSTTFSSTVEPTIYLLAFGFGFGSLVSTVGGYDYVEFVGTGTVATAVLFSSAFPAMFGTFIKYQFQRTYDAILAAPVDTEELVTAEALWIATRAGVYGCVPLLVAMAFGLDPAWGMLTVPLIALPRRLRLGVLRDRDRRLRQVDRELQLHHQRGADAALPRRGHVLPAQRPARAGRRSLANFNPLHHCVELVRHAAFGFEGWADLARVGVLVVFGARHVARRDPRDDAQARSTRPGRSPGGLAGRRRLGPCRRVRQVAGADP